jgi:flagellar motor switch protein FliM
MTPPAAFDFRKPPPGELVRRTEAWVTLACRRAGGPWAKLLPYPAEWKPGPVEAVTVGGALVAFPEDAVAVRATTADPADGGVVVAMPRPLLLALVAGLVGEAPAALPADREPTEVEASLVGYLVKELFLAPLEKGWAAADPPELTPGAAVPPRAAWAGAAGDPALLAATTVTAPFGESPVFLLVPRAGRWERLALPEPVVRTAAPADRERIEALVREMPVDLDVVLGTADLTMRDLSGLRAGDVLVLRRKVTQPLDGTVAGARKFRVWPGAVGSRAAVVIDAPAAD